VTVGEVHATPPIVTDEPAEPAPVVNDEPAMVTEVPPSCVPDEGVMLDTEGPRYWKALENETPNE
jgi:hypothetical protein